MLSLSPAREWALRAEIGALFAGLSGGEPSFFDRVAQLAVDRNRTLRWEARRLLRAWDAVSRRPRGESPEARARRLRRKRVHNREYRQRPAVKARVKVYARAYGHRPHVKAWTRAYLDRPEVRVRTRGVKAKYRKVYRAMPGVQARINALQRARRAKAKPAQLEQAERKAA